MAMLCLAGIFLLPGCILFPSGAVNSVGIAEQEDLLIRAVFQLDELMDNSAVAVPQKILDRAQGMIIFPSLIKAGLIGGAQAGQGVVAVRSGEEGSWSRPAFVRLHGASLGLQAGIQSIDLVLVFLTRKSLKNLFEKDLTLGRDLAVTAGPLGHRVEVDPLQFIRQEKSVFSYSAASGAFAGASFNGVLIEPDDTANQRFYGRPITPKTILLSGDMRSLPEQGKRFIKEMNKIAPPRGFSPNQ
jgi:lipid-binding SYLF domain-containing protein